MNTRAKSPRQSFLTVLITSITAILNTINIQCHQRTAQCALELPGAAKQQHGSLLLPPFWIQSLISILRQSLKNHPLGPADSH